MAKPEPPHGYDGKNRPIWALDEKGVPICGYRKKDGNLCQQTRLCDNGRCACPPHGGTSTGRPLVTGEHSQYLKNLQIAGKVEILLQDPDLAGHRQSIAELEALAQKAGEGYEPTAEMWAQMEKLWVACGKLYAKFVQDEDAVAGRELKSLLTEGLETAQTGLTNALHEDRFIQLKGEALKHRKAENRLNSDLQANLNAKEANAVGIGLIAALLRRKGRLLDDLTLGEIANDIARISGPPSLPGTHVAAG